MYKTLLLLSVSAGTLVGSIFAQGRYEEAGRVKFNIKEGLEKTLKDEDMGIFILTFASSLISVPFIYRAEKKQKLIKEIMKKLREKPELMDINDERINEAFNELVANAKICDGHSFIHEDTSSELYFAISEMSSSLLKAGSFEEFKNGWFKDRYTDAVMNQKEGLLKLEGVSNLRNQLSALEVRESEFKDDETGVYEF